MNAKVANTTLHYYAKYHKIVHDDIIIQGFIMRGERLKLHYQDTNKD